MGTSSKRASNPGSSGKKKWIEVVHREPVKREVLKVLKKGQEPTLVTEIEMVETKHIISVVRPNRGRNLSMHRRMSRRGHRGLRLADLGKKNIQTARTQTSPSVTAKPTLLSRAKRLFQRKGDA